MVKFGFKILSGDWGLGPIPNPKYYSNNELFNKYKQLNK